MSLRTLVAIVISLTYSAYTVAHKPVSDTKPTFANGTWVDLSYDYSAETLYWPTAEGFQLSKDFEGVTEGGYYYAANRFKTAEHGGTHIDAPIHFARHGHTVDQIPLEQLIAPAVVIDVSEHALSNRDYQVSIADIKNWEQRYRPLPKGCILLLRTGYGRYWPDRERYLGTAQTGPAAVPLLHFPGLSPEAAKWLVSERDINAIGLDTPSIDYGQSKQFMSHRILFEKNVPAFENLANLDRLPAQGATVIALPMKIKSGSGSPLRIVARLP